jgi:predicted small lipoprotein YifL
VNRRIRRVTRSTQRSRKLQSARSHFFYTLLEAWGCLRCAGARQRKLFAAVSAVSAVSALLALTATLACGKKGPPLPPLLKVPVAPPDLVASRRGDIVDLQFTVPSTNTDGTRPANVERLEIYAMTTASAATPVTLTDAQIVKYGTRIDEVDVKAPRDPNLTADPDDPAEEVEPPEGDGLDQGAVARVEEALGDDALELMKLPRDPLAPKPKDGGGAPPGPLLGPASEPPSRSYAVVGVSTRGKRGPVSKRVAVPLAAPPAAPAAPKIAYTEREITVTWPTVVAAADPASTETVLPSHPLGAAPPPTEYNVYDATDPQSLVKLTTTPLTDAKYSDNRITWGAKRCYTVRATVRIGSATIESDAGPPECKTFVDTFAPAAPSGLAAIASANAINLIWEPNPESDLAGYIVLRGTPHEGAKEPIDLEPITPSPIAETRFTDNVAAGIAHVYAVKAVDRAGNASAASAPVTETAR